MECGDDGAELHAVLRERLLEIIGVRQGHCRPGKVQRMSSQSGGHYCCGLAGPEPPLSGGGRAVSAASHPVSILCLLSGGQKIGSGRKAAPCSAKAPWVPVLEVAQGEERDVEDAAAAHR